jgi:hypothetical protein
MFLEDIFDTQGCPPVDVMAVEWHHFPFDARCARERCARSVGRSGRLRWPLLTVARRLRRYGSPPHINTIVSLLNDCGILPVRLASRAGGA